jgi:hypothetical protein
MRSNAIRVQSVQSECNPCDPRALIATTCDRLAVSSDDLRALATTYEDLFTSFPSICTSERSSEALHFFHIFTSSYMYFTFLLCFFLLFFLSPFAFLGFYTVDYIYSCTLHCSIASDNQTLFPPRFAPRSHSRFVPFDLRTLAQHSQPSPITSLLLRTRLATFAHPYTCDRRCLFCFGHGQRCASASPGQCIHPTLIFLALSQGPRQKMIKSATLYQDKYNMVVTRGNEMAGLAGENDRWEFVLR